MALLSGLIGPVTELVGGVIKNRQEIGKAKQTAKLEQIKSGAEWESKMAAASGASWKDEFGLLSWRCRYLWSATPSR